MPWHLSKHNGKICVKDKSGKQMHCYPDSPEGNARAKKYMAALYANAGEELKEVGNGLYLNKEANGTYKIIAVSTAQVKDRDDETFGVEAIDYDIAIAESTGIYPEVRVFHKKYLGIGKIEKMRRVGIFAVDEGHSYDDPFSLQVCEKMLSNNDGKWRVSRGFYALEVSGDCPRCKEHLLVEKQHMLVGFLCPTCKSYHSGYRGVLSDVHFRKTQTFDVSVTDVPCVPYTGVTAIKDYHFLEEDMATKKEIEKKLLEAGISKEAVDERLGSLTEEQLKEFSGIPVAEVLKEFTEEVEVDEPEEFVLAKEVLEEFASIVEEKVEAKLKEALDGFELEIPDVNFKEIPAVAELAEQVAELKEMVSTLLGKDRQRIKEAIEEMPRNGKLRVLRYKSKPVPPEDEEDDDEEEEDEEVEVPSRKKSRGDEIIGSDGFRASNMTEFISGGAR